MNRIGRGLPRPARRGLAALAAALGLHGSATPVAAQGHSPASATALAALARVGDADEPEGATGLAQALHDCRNDAVAVLVASHPDDQYVLPAAYLRMHGGWRVHVVLLTRGEGGQNSEGPEVGDALGARRAIETEACARRLGFQVHHLNRPDEGYSKSAAETLELWGAESTARDLAQVLRRVRADVVITTHHPDEPHGHDLGLLEILPRAIELAGAATLDTPGLPPIRIRRAIRGAHPGERATLTLPVDSVDPERGLPYRTMAYRALVETHRSQAPFRGIDDFFGTADRYVPIPGTPGAERSGELYEGVPTMFTALSGHTSAVAIGELQQRFETGLVELVRTGSVEDILGEAVDLRSRLRAIRDGDDPDARARIARRIAALERLIRRAVGLHVEVEAAELPWVVPGDTFLLAVKLRSTNADALVDPAFAPADARAEFRVLEAFATANPQPWTLRASWRVADDALGADPLTDLFVRETFAMPIRGELSFRVRVGRARSDPITVPVELPLAVRPAVELVAHPDTVLVPDGVREVSFNIRVVRNTVTPLDGTLRVQAPPGFDVQPAAVPIEMSTRRERGNRFVVAVPAELRPGPQPLRVSLGRARARIVLSRIEVGVPSELRVGLVAGVDDASRNVLRQLGCTLVPLGESDLPTRGLDDLDTIVVDTRALRHHAAGRAEFDRLIDFARRGGRLVVLYHKPAEFDVTATGSRFFPRELPFRLGEARVTRQDAPVEILLPDHPLLTTPNRLRIDDWDGWVQERGLYFPEDRAPGYEQPLRMHDPGEPAHDGALLYARVGDGDFVYCALALHRQLKNLHDGACRLFANLVTPAR